MVLRGLASVVRTIFDLVLPGDCAGCGAIGGTAGLCDACAATLRESPAATRPTPAPAGLPPCVSGGSYEGPLRELILAYKERGRRTLAAPLGDALAAVVAAGAGGRPDWPLALVPIPATAAAVRARHGDHMLRLARRAQSRLSRLGFDVTLLTPLRARPRADSAQLDRVARADAAREAFAVRRGFVPGSGDALSGDALVVLLDDVLTTGSTLAAAALCLASVGAPVTFAATLAATRLRHASHSPGGVIFESNRSWDAGDAGGRKG